MGFDVSWGTGENKRSFMIRHSPICQRSLILACSDGYISLNFEWLNEGATQERCRDRFKDLVVERLQLPMPENWADKGVRLPLSDWGEKVEDLIQLLGDLLHEFREPAV